MAERQESLDQGHVTDESQSQWRETELAKQSADYNDKLIPTANY
jgi:hypothetical protein